eukprot:scaffold177238_cov18-Tisochrysis_lutea.AAC.1
MQSAYSIAVAVAVAATFCHGLPYAVCCQCLLSSSRLMGPKSPANYLSCSFLLMPVNATHVQEPKGWCLPATCVWRKELTHPAWRDPYGAAL